MNGNLGKVEVVPSTREVSFLALKEKAVKFYLAAFFYVSFKESSITMWNRFFKSRKVDFSALYTSWEVTSPYNVINPGASQEEIEETEEALKHKLPQSFRTLYGLTNGLSILESNLNIVPLNSDEWFSLVNYTKQLREWEKPIPQEVLAFADNGSDGTFGIWLDENEFSDSPVISVGAIYEPGCMAIAGTSLFNFMLGWSAYYFLLLEVDTKALDIIQLPKKLRFKAHELEDEQFAEIRKWADPRLPDFDPDPYKLRYTVSQVREILQRSG